MSFQTYKIQTTDFSVSMVVCRLQLSFCRRVYTAWTMLFLTRPGANELFLKICKNRWGKIRWKTKNGSLDEIYFIQKRINNSFVITLFLRTRFNIRPVSIWNISLVLWMVMAGIVFLLFMSAEVYGFEFTQSLLYHKASTSGFFNAFIFFFIDVH